MASQDRVSTGVKRDVHLGEMALARRAAIRNGIASVAAVSALLCVAVYFHQYAEDRLALQAVCWLLTAGAGVSSALRSVRDWRRLQAAAGTDGELMSDA